MSKETYQQAVADRAAEIKAEWKQAVESIEAAVEPLPSDGMRRDVLRAVLSRYVR